MYVPLDHRWQQHITKKHHEVLISIRISQRYIRKKYKKVSSIKKKKKEETQ